MSHYDRLHPGLTEAVTATRARLHQLQFLAARVDAEIVAERARLDTLLHKPTPGPGGTPARCGTDSGYYRHRRTLKEPACAACTTAHREAQRARWHRARANQEQVSA